MITEDNELTTAIKSIKQPLTLLDINFQKKLIKVILEDKNGEFSSQIIDILKPEYFDGIHLRTLIRYIIDYVSKYNIIPEYSTLIDVINEKEAEGSLKDNLVETVRLIEEHRITDKLNVKDTSLNFCRKQSLKNGLMNAFEKWGQGNYDDVSQIITDALKVGEPKNSGHDYLFDVEKRLIKQYRSPITFLKGIDSKIGGGLAGGELGIILSPTGGGKSMVLVKAASNALEAGKKVVYYTVELQECVVGNRLDSCLTGVPIKDVIEYPDVIREKIMDLTSKGGNIKVQEFPTGGASVNTLRSHLKMLERDGFIPDIIFVDYADIMKSTSNYHSEVRHELKSIYEGLRGLAMELNVPIWTAAQAGRCLELSTIIETPNGKIQIKDIKEGDFILTHLGFKKVIQVYPIETQTTYKIKTKSGKEITCSEKHEFPTKDGLKSIESGLNIKDILYVKNKEITQESIIDLIEDEIVSIELCGERETIDISVEETNMFFANDIYTHNSAMTKDKFGLDTISESIGKAQVADVVLGLARSDPDKAEKKANLMMLKNRNGEDGYTMRLHFDTTKIDIRLEDDNGTNMKAGLKGLNIEQQIRNNNNN